MKNQSENKPKMKLQLIQEAAPAAGSDKSIEDAAKAATNGDFERIPDVLDDCKREALDIFKYYDHAIKRAENAGDDELKADLLFELQHDTDFDGNPLFIGPTGAAKTSIIKQWAKANGIEVIQLPVSGDPVDFLGVTDIADMERPVDDKGNTEVKPTKITASTRIFDIFRTGNFKILFLDEINTANEEILQKIYDLLSFHIVKVGDDQPIFLNKLLFCTAAMNPKEYGSCRHALDTALKRRLIPHIVGYDTESYKKHLLARIDKYITEAEYALKELQDDKNASQEDIDDWKRVYDQMIGRKRLAETVLSDENFTWATPAEVKASNASDSEGVLIPPKFGQALNNCNGTKEDFIKKARNICGRAGADRITAALLSYTDLNHPANAIWGKDYTPGEVKQSEEATVIPKADSPFGSISRGRQR